VSTDQKIVEIGGGSLGGTSREGRRHGTKQGHVGRCSPIERPERAELLPGELPKPATILGFGEQLLQLFPTRGMLFDQSSRISS
jgi:hypothetical protein